MVKNCGDVTRCWCECYCDITNRKTKLILLANVSNLFLVELKLFECVFRVGHVTQSEVLEKLVSTYTGSYLTRNCNLLDYCVLE